MNLNNYTDPFSSRAKDLAMKFDKAFIERNTSEIYDLINYANEIVKSEDIASQAQIYYSIATAYGDISNISSMLGDENLKEYQLYYFRRSIGLVNENSLKNPKIKPYVTGLKLNLYTNYANVLDQCGRKISAIGAYHKVLSINDKFGMALGNLGICYQYYAMLISDPGHRDYLHHFAYRLLKQSLVDTPRDIYKNEVNYFEKAMYVYDSEYINKVLSKPLDIPKYTYDNKEEYEYRKWALDNNLFLNPLNDLPIFEFAFAADVIQLPSMIMKVDEKPVFHGMFNQFKQEYIYARYQYYCNYQETDEVNFADKDTKLINLADYPQYSIRIENIKSSFKILYSMLDKISFFINSYFKLGIKERDVSFHSIWKSEKKGRNGYKYSNVLNPNENFALESIYWISKDFYKKLVNSPNPHAKRVSEIRNALEHKYVKIYSNINPKRINGEIDDLALYVSEYELIQETFDLLKLLREIIICLSLAVKIEEDKRRQEFNEKIIPSMSLQEYEDEWKV